MRTLSMSLVLLCVFSVVRSAEPSPVAPFSMTIDEQAIVDLTNAERRKAGKEPVTPNAVLFAVARKHADDMMHAGKLEHRLNGKNSSERVQAAGYHWLAVSENIAFNHRTVTDVVSNWMRSEGHRTNVLSTDVNEIGVGIATNPSGEPYWVQVFAKADPDYPNPGIPPGPGAPPRLAGVPFQIPPVKFSLRNVSPNEFVINVYNDKQYIIKPGETVEFALASMSGKPQVYIQCSGMDLEFIAKQNAKYTVNFTKEGLELVQGR